MRTFDGDVAYVRRFLETIEGPIVLAAHSYAGSVISAPEAITEEVVSLVFVAAFQQESGESAGQLNGMMPGSKLTSDNLVVRPYPGGNEVYVAPDRFGEVYAADVEPEHLAVMAAAQHPFDPTTLSGTFVGEPTWRRLPSRAIVSTADWSIPTEILRFMATRANSITTEIDSSHAVPVAHPDTVAAVIRAAVRSVEGDAS